jgi:hypothetical protein
MSAPAAILELVARFERNLEAYRSGQYNETQLRREFLDPFFQALGWDVQNEQGLAEAYKDVIHEDQIRIGGATKAPDYCFRVGGTRKFFVEAKRPSISVKDESGAALQLRRYAWSASLPLNILSNFGEFAVYDGRFKPHMDDPAATARTFYCTFGDYAEKWDWIASIFSRDAVFKGAFDKYADSTKAKKGTAEFDGDFLAAIEGWRLDLARNLALRNPRLTQRELNFAVQRIIDRIVFLRICEDRGLEDYGRLQALVNGDRVYPRLCQLFEEADRRYNSGLFHFQAEPGRHEPPDELTLTLEIDDKLLRDILRALYYPDSPYEFSVIPADILGQVYERFLGKVIRLTEGHRAAVEEKPEVRKAGGVYYTPTYVVDYIVRQTVGKLVEGRTPRQVSALRVLDPACGSGSFLIGAYQFLLDWHREWYEGHDAAKWAKGAAAALCQTGRGWRLTIAERKRILLNHIFGVDIDAQAVEVTKLSLLLKVLEGETGQTLQSVFRVFHERALPDLGDNIKCGNSLIGADFFNGPQLSLFDDDEVLRINVFDWKAEFGGASRAGGFDAVIGNPPWGASFTEPELAYLRERYSRVVARMIDSYIYFMDRATQLARPEAPIGFIVPSTVLNQVDARPVRELLLSRGLTTLLNLGQGVFGSKVLNTSTVLVSGVARRNALVVADLSRLPVAERPDALAKAKAASWKAWRKQVEAEPDRTFFTGPLDGTALLQRLRQRHPALNRFIAGAIQRGVSPDVAAAHTVSKADARRLALEPELLRPSVSGSQIKRYQVWRIDQHIIYTTRDTPIRNYPRVLGFLERFKHENTCKEAKEGRHPWWSLHRPRDPAIFASPKFIGLTTSRTIELVYDESASAFVTDAMYVFRTVAGVDAWALMAIMQSRLFLFLYRVSNQGESRVIPQVKASKLGSLPFPACDRPQPVLAKLNARCRQMYELHQREAAARTPHEKTALARQIAATGALIDRLVYGLYGLTEEEIGIVEGASRWGG